MVRHKGIRLLTWVALAALCLPMGGCFLVHPIIVPAVTAGTLTYAGITPPDIITSAITGKECSLLKYEQGEPYCSSEEEATGPELPLYCYRTIGDVDCYRTPADPYLTRPLPNDESIPAP